MGQPKSESIGTSGHVDVAHSKVLADELTMNDAFEAENAEHEQTLWQSVKSHPKACFWAFIMCFTIVSPDSPCHTQCWQHITDKQTGYGILRYVPQRQLRGASCVPERVRDLCSWGGLDYRDEVAECSLSVWTVWCLCRSVSFWSHHQQAGISVDHTHRPSIDECHHLHLLLCKSDDRWLTTHFTNSIFQADSLALLTVGQALEGVPWGFFIANSPAYASEVTPLALRGACTATLQMSWSIGSIIVAAATLGFNKRSDQWAWRAPLALQWIFPVRSAPKH